MADDGEALSKFCELTGADETNAKAYLEAANNDLEIAVQHFFNEDGDQWNAAPPADPKTSAPPPKPNKPRFGTIAGFSRSSSSDSDEEDEPQAFYAGGSTHSGQQVLGPRAQQPPIHIVSEMFRSAREHGAQILNPSEPGSSKQGTIRFGGAGYRLGQTSSDSQAVSSSSSSSSSSSASAQERREVIIKLKFWCNGFSIDDGPLRKYSCAKNAQFLKTISRGEIPEELLRQAQGNEIQLSLDDRSHEEFNQAQVKTKAFSGKGNILGSPVPGQTVSAEALTPAENRGECEARARELVPIDTSLPTTNVQIRLIDGSRLVVTLNHTHTIADLRNYITTARPEFSSVTFNLLTSFPSKVLSEENLTLADAQILGASLLQRLT